MGIPLGVDDPIPSDSISQFYNVQDYFDGTNEPAQLGGSILILSGGNATGARFARVKTYQGYNTATQTWRVIVKDSDGVIDADQQWFHDNVHAAAVGTYGIQTSQSALR